MDFHDEITLLGAIGTNGLPLMTNVENSFRSGLEVDLSIKLGDLTLSNSSSYMYCEVKTDSGTFKPVMTPDLIINQAIVYTYKDADFGVNFRYLTDRYMDLGNEYIVPGSYCLDLSLCWHFDIHDIIIGVNNILVNDEIGALSMGNGYIDWDGPRYFVEAPRNFFVTLHLNF